MTENYKNFRVRTPVRTFRDLEVYQESTKLAAQIFNFKLPAKYKEELAEEIQNLKQMAKVVPKLIELVLNIQFPVLAYFIIRVDNPHIINFIDVRRR